MKTLLSLVVLFIFTFTSTSVTAEEGWFYLDQSLSKVDTRVNDIVVSVIKNTSSITLSRRRASNKDTNEKNLEFISEVKEGEKLFFKCGPHTIYVHVLVIYFNERRVKLDVQIDPDIVYE